MSSTLRQRALRWLSATALGAALALPLAAQAAPMQLDFYFDLDNSASSGCSTHAAGQNIQGFERAVRIRYDDAAHTVDAASVAQCSGGSLQAPSALDVSLWRVAPDPGNAAQVVLSGSIPAAVFPAAPSGVVVTSSASGSVLSVLGGNPGFASLRGLHGIAVPSSGPVPVPTLGHWALLALALALAALAWRRRQAAGQLLGLTGASLLGLLMLGSPGQAQAGSVTITPPAGGTAQPGQVLRAEFQQDSPQSDMRVKVVIQKAEKPMLKGRFIDAPVENLHYVTASGHKGVTGKNGEFHYAKSGEIVNFMLSGKQPVGFAPAAPEIHVFDLKNPLTLQAKSHELYANRVAQLLQSLDLDKNPENGIQLAPRALSVFEQGETLDFSITQEQWDEKLKAVASRSQTGFRTIEQSHEHAKKTLRRRENSCSSFPDVTYLHIFGSRTSVANRTCQQKAEALAFYEYTLPEMLNGAQQVLDNELLTRGDQIFKEDLEELKKNNFASRVAGAVADFAEVLSKAPENALEHRSQMAKISAAVLSLELPVKGHLQTCKNHDAACRAAQEEINSNALLAVVSARGDVLECAQQKYAACMNAVVRILEEGPYKEQPDAFIRQAANQITDFLKAADAIGEAISESTSNPELADSAVGDFITALTRVGVGEHFVREGEMIGYAANAALIASEAIDVVLSCRKATVSPTTTSLQGFAKCAKKTTDYVVARAGEIVLSVGVMIAAEDMKRDAYAATIAAAYMHKRLAAGNEHAMIAGYSGVAVRQPPRDFLSDQEYRAMRAIAIKKIADEIDMPLATIFGTKLDQVIDTLERFELYLKTTTRQVLEGKISSCSLVDVGKLKSLEIQMLDDVPVLSLGKPANFTADYKIRNGLSGFVFDFGDGSDFVPSDISAARHTYSKEGVYTARVIPLAQGYGRNNLRVCTGRGQSLTFRVQDTVVKVDEIAPTSVEIGQRTKITVKGKNLPKTALMVIDNASCDEPAPLRYGKGFTQYCTFSGDAGLRPVKVKASANGLVIDASRKIKVLESGNPAKATALAPAIVNRDESTLFTVIGQDLPATAGIVFGGSENHCGNVASLVPAGSGFKQACRIRSSGDEKVAVVVDSATNEVLGRFQVQVLDGTAPKVTALTPAEAVIGQSVQFTVKGQGLTPAVLIIEGVQECSGRSPNAEGFTQTCTLGGSAGTRTVRVQLPGQKLVDLRRIQALPAAPAPVGIGKIPHTGVTAQQCYKKGSDALVACNSAEAIALSNPGKQDGMRGHINAMSYSEVPGFARTECVKDNLTGLMWEGKTSDGGLRDGGKRYTNHGDGRAGDASEYVNQVNAQGLCGHHDWRLPTVDELHSLVDFSKPYPGPTIDTAWFPNTPGADFWSGTPYAGNPAYAWVVHFGDGVAGDLSRNLQRAVRLVRASQ
ncbi:hypothetical protein CK620_05540 [Vandammella animalimorsus]|uniref:PKD domain-containing protein n=1 Tax=Vandammella animalimorsus TaxID=2029117 RepID=A0A2A2AC68_9BURK|nr:hypothetical protein CK620_05540 [Vandammella animalimorsus]